MTQDGSLPSLTLGQVAQALEVARLKMKGGRNPDPFRLSREQTSREEGAPSAAREAGGEGEGDQVSQRRGPVTWRKEGKEEAPVTHTQKGPDGGKVTSEGEHRAAKAWRWEGST